MAKNRNPAPPPPPTPAPRPRGNSGPAAGARNVVAVLREDLARRTPPIPGGLMARLEEIAAQTRPAPRQRRKPEPLIFGLPYVGWLLAACLAISVGVAMYLQHRAHDGATPLKPEVGALAEGPSLWDAAARSAGMLLDGRIPAVERNAEDPGLPEFVRRRGLGGGLSAEAGGAFRLLGVRSQPTDAGAGVWFVFGEPDGRRAAVLMAPAGPTSPQAGERVERTGTDGRALLAWRVGEHVLLAAGPDRATVDRLAAGLTLGR